MTIQIHPLAKTAFIVLGLLGGLQLLQAGRRRRLAQRGQKQQPLQTWEGEGGAVPVSSNRIAAEVAPSGGAGGTT